MFLWVNFALALSPSPCERSLEVLADRVSSSLYPSFPRFTPRIGCSSARGFFHRDQDMSSTTTSTISTTSTTSTTSKTASIVPVAEAAVRQLPRSWNRATTATETRDGNRRRAASRSRDVSNFFDWRTFPGKVDTRHTRHHRIGVVVDKNPLVLAARFVPGKVQVLPVRISTEVVSPFTSASIPRLFAI